MIVYVESNFIVEFALEQEELPHVEAILAAAEAGTVALAIPAFSIAEPIATVMARPKKRAQNLKPVSDIGDQLARSAAHASLVDELRQVTAKLGMLDAHERDRLQVVLRRVLATATMIPTTFAVFEEAATFASALGMTLSDSIVLASVLADLREREGAVPKAFVQRNPRDFDVMEVVDALAARGCTLVTTFKAGAALV